MNIMKVISLFSGAGGMDLGFIQAGHEIIWANDLYEDAAETYKKNIGNHIVLKDLKEVDTTNIPDGDIVIGGFPCQGFSVANMNRSVDDERNTLYLEMLRVIQDKQPKFFVAENVKGILSLGKGAVIKMICKDFENAGYNVQYKLLNAADYGVPQTRQRVFIVGVRKDLDLTYSYPIPTHEESPTFDLFNLNALQKWVTIGEALSDIPEPDEAHNLLNHVYSQYRLKFNGYIGHRVTDPNKPSPTVTARGDNKGGAVINHHPKNHRRLSVREVAIIQSFPLDYEFVGSTTSCYRQIGNAVPPLLAYYVAKEISS
ncbi:DNA cytosine methyltransferase [Bacillus wiedmannii]|uniref:DNA cytosine methyltransferase n=1 Tax=Bacillus wiedmannii TaxID=1890302 RepID=UPI000BF1610F|nr:DNA cytosine methyltransferase [Bacillus wiedmannii]PEK02201.1 DNA (cytosine-5-)-methyltransferase [Bacillus wiedmannii]